MRSSDERSAQVRIRDAAVEVFAADGSNGMTARRVAEVANVSPGLVMHHFGSMDGLRRACDEHLLAAIKTTKAEALGGGSVLDLASLIRQVGDPNLPGYLARVLVEDSEASAELVDQLVEDADEYVSAGIAAGTIKPSADEKARTRVLTLFSLGALVLPHHAKRLIGVDVTDPGTSPAALVDYFRPAFEILGDGIFTDQFIAIARQAFEAVANEQENQ